MPSTSLPPHSPHPSFTLPIPPPLLLIPPSSPSRSLPPHPKCCTLPTRLSGPPNASSSHLPHPLKEAIASCPAPYLSPPVLSSLPPRPAPPLQPLCLPLPSRFFHARPISSPVSPPCPPSPIPNLPALPFAFHPPYLLPCPPPTPQAELGEEACASLGEQGAVDALGEALRCAALDLHSHLATEIGEWACATLWLLCTHPPNARRALSAAADTMLALLRVEGGGGGEEEGGEEGEGEEVEGEEGTEQEGGGGEREGGEAGGGEGGESEQAKEEPKTGAEERAETEMGAQGEGGERRDCRLRLAALECVGLMLLGGELLDPLAERGALRLLQQIAVEVCCGEGERLMAARVLELVAHAHPAASRVARVEATMIELLNSEQEASSPLIPPSILPPCPPLTLPSPSPHLPSHSFHHRLTLSLVDGSGLS